MDCELAFGSFLESESRTPRKPTFFKLASESEAWIANSLSDRFWSQSLGRFGNLLFDLASESEAWIANSLRIVFGVRVSDASETHFSIMVKKNRAKAAPFLARSQEDDIKRRAVVEEADAKWRRLESKKPDHALGAIEEAFISYSPMSDIVQEEQDDTSVDEILPFEETMSDSGKISEDGTIANSVGDVGKPAGNNIESNLAGINPSTEEATEGSFRTPSSKDCLAISFRFLFG